MEYSNIFLYPDPILYQPTELVTTVTEDILQLGESLLTTAIDINAIGLAASQIGKPIKAIVVRELTEAGEQNYFALNPMIIDAAKELVDSWEGCMSFPGLNVLVKRYSEVTVNYMNVRGDYVNLKCSGLLSRAFQHEIDHINNILLIDRMSSTQKKRNKRYFKELEKFSKKLAKKHNICNTNTSF